MTQTGLRVSLGLAALVVWGVTWASTLSVGGGPVAAASSATRTTPSPTPSETLIPALVLTPTPSPSVKPARSPQPSPSPTPSRTPTATPTGTPSPAPSPTQAGATPTCTVAYRLSDSWSNGFIAAVGIGNTGSTAWNGWTLAFAFSGNQRITGAWNGSVAQSGASVTVKNVSSDGSVQPGGSTGFGFQATYSGRNVNPTSFTLNGRSCTTD